MLVDLGAAGSCGALAEEMWKRLGVLAYVSKYRFIAEALLEV